jgi:hypothetical protein
LALAREELDFPGDVARVETSLEEVKKKAPAQI